MGGPGLSGLYALLRGPRKRSRKKRRWAHTRAHAKPRTRAHAPALHHTADSVARQLVADLDKPDVMPVKASKAGHHTVAFDLSAVVGKKAKNLDELANEMMMNLDKGKGVGAHKHKAHTGGASALPPDIAAAVAKLKGSK